ncbi:MAG: hypothetical protein ACRER2_08395 [Methylococcales bacterium]
MSEFHALSDSAGRFYDASGFHPSSTNTPTLYLAIGRDLNWGNAAMNQDSLEFPLSMKKNVL